MKTNSKLVGCIDKIGSVIRTRFFYLNSETNEAKDVTLELCNAIDKFNLNAKEIRATGQYAMMIPYKYRYGLAEYGFGCGLSHYLQASEFTAIEEATMNHGEILSFPLSDCYISMFTPSDVKSILSCKGVFDVKIMDALKERYFSKELA